jgi:hypothetical protein
MQEKVLKQISHRIQSERQYHAPNKRKKNLSMLADKLNGEKT